MADAGETYVLDMGDPVRILDLVGRLVRLLDIVHPHLEYTGLRPGEKLHEVLFDDADTCGRTRHPLIDVMSARRKPRGRSSRSGGDARSSRRVRRQRSSSRRGARAPPADCWTERSLSVPA